MKNLKLILLLLAIPALVFGLFDFQYGIQHDSGFDQYVGCWTFIGGFILLLFWALVKKYLLGNSSTVVPKIKTLEQKALNY